MIMISLSKLNNVVVAEDMKTGIIGGGAKVKETIPVADAAGVIIQVGNCNSVGALKDQVSTSDMINYAGARYLVILQIRFVRNKTPTQKLERV